MIEEKRNKIMKSHIFECDNETIANNEEVSVEEVGGVLSDTEAVNKMAGYLKQEGYIPDVYNNLNLFTNYLDTSTLSAYSLCLARYNNSADYSNSIYDIHQYSSSGSISGISGNANMNYVFKEHAGSSSTTSNSNSSVTTSSKTDTIVKVHYGWYNTHYSAKTGFKISGDLCIFLHHSSYVCQMD